MKRNNKRGFSIIELVIVIAVIAILAGVLIPTFAGIIGKAQKSADDQLAANVRTTLYTYAENGQWDDTEYVIIGDNYYFTLKNGELSEGKKKDATIKCYDSQDAANDDVAAGVVVYVKWTLPEEIEAEDVASLKNVYVKYTTTE